MSQRDVEAGRATLKGDALQYARCGVPALLEAAADAQPEAPFLHLLDRGKVARSLTFAETRERVEHTVLALWSQGVRRGDVVATASRDPMELALWALALWRVGATLLPCPTPPRPSGYEAWARALAPAAKMAGLWAILAPADLRVVALRHWGPGRPQVDPETIMPMLERELPLPTAEDTALLQFLSGSLRRPSSPVLSHDNLVANVHALGAALQLGPGDRLLSWLPLHADMGLVGMLLTALAHGLPLFLMRTEAFLVRPIEWLRALSEYRITLTGAPDFAYRLVADRVKSAALAEADVDLGELRVALTGSEPITPAANRDFESLLRPFGLRGSALNPAYGLAHAGLAVSACSPQAEWGTLAHEGRQLVGLGRPVPGHSVSVTGESGEPLAEGREGMIRVRGPSVCDYILGPTETAGPRLDGDWLVTGDLGVIRDGQLLITGRAKRIAIKRGRNFALEDVEAVFAEAVGLPRREVHARVVGDGSECLEVLLPTALSDDAERVRPAQRALLSELGLRADRVGSWEGAG